MKTLVTYSSKGGNTKKVAEAIYQELVDGGKGNIELKHLDEVEDFDSYRAILIGYWADKGKADELATKYLPEFKNKDMGIFLTLGVDKDSEHAKEVVRDAKKKLENQGNRVWQSFVVQGSDYFNRSAEEIKITDEDLKDARNAFKNFFTLVEM